MPRKTPVIILSLVVLLCRALYRAFYFSFSPLNFSSIAFASHFHSHSLLLYFSSPHRVYIDNVLKLMRSSHRELEKKLAKSPEWVELWEHGRPSGTYKVRTHHTAPCYATSLYPTFLRTVILISSHLPSL